MTSENNHSQRPQNSKMARETLGRRTFLKGMGAAALFATPVMQAACGLNGDGSSGKNWNSPEDFPKKYTGYQGLSKLPFFELNESSQLELVADVPEILDYHTHLGFTIGESPKLDFHKDTERIKYFFACNPEQPACTFDISEYANNVLSEDERQDLKSMVFESVLQGTGPGATHTVPNFLDELSRMKVDTTVLQPVAANLIQPDNMTDLWHRALKEEGVRDRFTMYCSVHPKADNKLEKLRDYADRGFRGLKFHPPTMRIAPDADKSMEVFEECDKLGLPIFFHSGLTGFDSGDFADIKNYEKPIKTFPELPIILAHSGATQWETALEYANNYDNVWVDTAGPSLEVIQAFIDRFDTHKILFGSDWPWYPIATSLSKVLIATVDKPKVRRRILAKNARSLLDES